MFQFSEAGRGEKSRRKSPGSHAVSPLFTSGRTGSSAAHAKRTPLGCVFQALVLMNAPSSNLSLKTTGACLGDGCAASNTVYP